MSDLSEVEIIDRMRSSLREAIQAAEVLAVASRKGPTYNKLREHLGLVEGCCRQLSVYREDTRWLPIGKLMADCHAKAGGWLRGYKDPKTGIRHHLAGKTQNPLFLMLAANLKAIYQVAETVRTQRTGKVGMILPALPKAERRAGAPVQVLLPNGMASTPGGLILPTRLAG